MEKSYSFKLIDSTYSVEECSTVLTSLVDHKINFIKRTIFSKEERNDGDVTHLKKRLSELQELRQELKLWVMDQSKERCTMSIDCPVNVVVNKTESESAMFSVEIN